MAKYAVIGAGNSGLAMAAHLAFHGESVTIWNRTYKNISRLSESRRIVCTGTITSTVSIDTATSNMAEAIAGAEFIFVTTPASAHADIAREMAPFVQTNQRVILNPGRTLGALEFLKVLRESGCNQSPQVAETQTIVYTCRKSAEDSVEIFRYKNDVLLSCIDSSRNVETVLALPECLRKSFLPAKSIIETSIGNVGMVLHCFPVLLNVGWIENREVTFKYYYSGITESIAELLEKLDQERVGVAKELGHKVEDIISWFQRSYGIRSDKLYDAIQGNEAYRTIDAPHSLRHRYIYEDIPCGLVPLESMGHALGMRLPITTMCIDLADIIVSENFRKSGRNLDALGISIDELMKM